MGNRILEDTTWEAANPMLRVGTHHSPESTCQVVTLYRIDVHNLSQHALVVELATLFPGRIEQLIVSHADLAARRFGRGHDLFRLRQVDGERLLDIDMG